MGGSELARDGERGRGLGAAVVRDTDGFDLIRLVGVAARGDGDGADRPAHGSASVVADQHAPEGPGKTTPRPAGLRRCRCPAGVGRCRQRA